MIERGTPAQSVLAPQHEQCEELERAERGVLQRALARCGGNVSAAAKTLGISRATLHRKLHRTGLARTA
jgi:transcriptional regulator of acetoin/glycerol metabolism